MFDPTIQLMKSTRMPAPGAPDPVLPSENTPQAKIFSKKKCDILQIPVLIDKEMAGKDDKIFIEGIKKQNEKVIAEIYNRYFPSVRQFIFKNNGSSEDARDIFNDAVIVIMEKIRDNTLDLRCSLKTYLYAISKNLWLKKMGGEKLETISYEEIEGTLACAEQIEEELINVNRAGLLYQKHLARMSLTCRRLLEYFLEGRSYREITELMHYENESYARKRKYRCIKILVRRIKADPDYKNIYDDND